MGNKTNSLSDNYIDQLTWLRGLAAFFVIVSHTLRAIEVKYSPDDESISSSSLYLLDLGSFGVVLFFVLSGCTLYISNSGAVDRKNIIVFYIKRFFRIWPAFVVSLAIYICFGFIFSALYIAPQGYWIEGQFLLSYSIYDLFSYLSFVFNITGPGGLFNNAYWSLPVEFQYYLIFPLIVASLKFGVFGPVFIGGGLYLLSKLGFFGFDDNIVFTLAFSFCGGVLVGYVYKKSTFIINSIVGICIMIALLFLAVAITRSFIVLPDIPIISDMWSWYGILAIIMVFVVMVTKLSFHHKIEAFLKHYGTISYSTYLYHNLFVATAVLLTIHFEVHDGNSRLFFTFFFTLLTSYFVAIVSYKYVEKPFVLLGRKVVKKYQKKKDNCNSIVSD